MSRLAGSLGIRIAVVGLFVVGGFFFRDRLSSNPDQMRVGDCFEEPAQLDSIAKLQHQPCGEAHDLEVIFAGDHPAGKGASVPSDDEFESFAITKCLPAFTAYAGLDVMSQEVLLVDYYVPTDASWRAGDRQVICYAGRVDGATMTQSVSAAH